MRVALLCSGLGRVRRGHETFAQQLFDSLADRVDLVLFKGGGASGPRENVISHVPRRTSSLNGMRLPSAARWRTALEEQERIRIEGVTFAYGALAKLLDGAFDVIHCLEREVCDIVYRERHLFSRQPAVLFSNGGAIPRWDLPGCDFVQEYSQYNLSFSDPARAFVIPHGVDVNRFRPGLASPLRRDLGIPSDVLVVLSVGAIGLNHKRIDHVVREVSKVKNAWLIVVGEEESGATSIREEAERCMDVRVKFVSLPHERMHEAYAAADVFVLGSVFETFGIAYIEAMACGLPVVCTDHPNQRSIVKEGVFVDMRKTGALTAALGDLRPSDIAELGERARFIACKYYDIDRLVCDYIAAYHRIASLPAVVPSYSLRHRIAANMRSALRKGRELVSGRAE